MASHISVRCHLIARHLYFSVFNLAFACVEGMLHMKKVIITENKILVLGMERVVLTKPLSSYIYVGTIAVRMGASVLTKIPFKPGGGDTHL